MKLVYADINGQIYDHPELYMVGRTGEYFTPPEKEEMIPLPEGASLALLPQRIPVGSDANGGITVARDPYQSKQVYAVAALLPQGYTRTLLPAYRPANGEARPLPLYGYAAVAWEDDMFWVAAVQSDEGSKWNPVNYNTAELPGLVKQKKEAFPGNRIIKQLAHCALKYHCFTAQNIFYSRWEGGIPSSPRCNASCLSCISKQPAECCPSPQERIDFEPTVEEIGEIAIPHLHAPEAIISFGQGCEGEPSLAAPILTKAIKLMRKSTHDGTININSNASNREGLLQMADAGLDSIRVTMISAVEKTYSDYHRPSGFSLPDITKTIKELKKRGVFVSLNLLTWPGLTDREQEIKAFMEFVAETQVDRIQLRNLNADPDSLWQWLKPEPSKILGLNSFIKKTKKQFPHLEIGSFSRSLR